jgi:hypothetical protein
MFKKNTRANIKKVTIDRFATVEFNGKPYYKKDDYDLTLGIKAPPTGPKLVEVNGLKNHQYHYARLIEGEWVITPEENRSYKVDKLFICAKVVMKLIAKREDFNHRKLARSQTRARRARKAQEKQPCVRKPRVVVIKEELKPRPAIIELDENEIYKNDNGEEVEIEVCGKRERKKCYYKAIDIQVGYDTIDIEKLMCDRASRFRRGKHFEYFLCNDEPELYLTFAGVTGILYGGNTESIAECFIDWCDDILFTARHGTADAKRGLAAKIAGVTPEQIIEIYKGVKKSFPCIYLFLVGDSSFARRLGIKLLRGQRVYKYGMAECLAGRTMDHMGTYGKMKGSTLKLVYFSYVDKKNLQEAENGVKDYFQERNMRVKGFKGHRELVIIHDDNIVSAKKRYNEMRDIYHGDTSEFQKEIAVIEKTIRDECEKDLKDAVAKAERYHQQAEERLEKVEEEARQARKDSKAKLEKMEEEARQAQKDFKAKFQGAKEKIMLVKDRVTILEAALRERGVMIDDDGVEIEFMVVKKRRCK